MRGADLVSALDGIAGLLGQDSLLDELLQCPQ